MPTDPRHKDRTDQFRILPGKDADGEPCFCLLVKRTYDIVPGQVCRRAAQDQPFIEVDHYYDRGDPEWAAVLHESDLVPYKQATDVVFIAEAHAPGGRPAAELEAAVEVDGYRKVIRVIGNRQCHHRKDKPPLFSEPEPFTRMEIRYENAYGGWDRKSIPDLPFAYPRNPLGTGMALKNSPEVIEGMPLPNLEDPADLLTPERLVLEEPAHWNDAPLPQGLGWFHKTWYPRCSFVGSLPPFARPGQALREERLGLVPADQVALARQFKLPGFDIRFNNGASPGLARPYLTCGKTIHYTHLDPDEEALTFQLPLEKPAMMLDIGLGENQLDARLFTVCVRCGQRQADLVWGAVHLYPGVDWLPEMKTLRAEVIQP